MPEEKERPRPHGDPLKDEIGGRANPEDNQAQRQSDASPDASGAGAPGREETDRDRGRGSDANGVPAFDEADGDKRRKHYDEGASLVSKID